MNCGKSSCEKLRDIVGNGIVYIYTLSTSNPITSTISHVLLQHLSCVAFPLVSSDPLLLNSCIGNHLLYTISRNFTGCSEAFILTETLKPLLNKGSKPCKHLLLSQYMLSQSSGSASVLSYRVGYFPNIPLFLFIYKGLRLIFVVSLD